MGIYLDHNATTPLDPRVRAAWREHQEAGLGNPSSLHGPGRRARALIDEARERLAAALGVHEDELVFTGGGTEAINLALIGRFEAGPAAAQRIGLASIEHAAVIECARALERRSAELVWIPVDSLGKPRIEPEFEALAACDLLSLPWANGEIGAVWPVADLAARLRAGGFRGTLFSDLVQAVGRVPVDLRAAGLDLAAISAHKLGGPLGVGVLFVRRGVRLAPRSFGGGQEAGLRPGTEDAARIAAAALAIELALGEQRERAARWREQSQLFLAALARHGLSFELNGPAAQDPERLPNTLNLSASGGDGKVLVTRLDLEGLEVSSGSACASGSIEPSHVLRALGRDDDAARRGLRLSLGSSTRAEELERAAEILARVLGAPPSR
jgi:cysteine desulfurase